MRRMVPERKRKLRTIGKRSALGLKGAMAGALLWAEEKSRVRAQYSAWRGPFLGGCAALFVESVEKRET
jgi:hypothetical protein